jgi:isopenicillin N synthase-like dioxygenase
MAATAPAVPIVDFARWADGSTAERQAFADELGEICHKVGFFQLINHNVDDGLQQRVKAMTRELFQLPLEAKQAISKELSPHFRGWEALGTERTNGRVDFREQVDTWSDCACTDSQCVFTLCRLRVVPLLYVGAPPSVTRTTACRVGRGCVHARDCCLTMLL